MFSGLVFGGRVTFMFLKPCLMELPGGQTPNPAESRRVPPSPLFPVPWKRKLVHSSWLRLSERMSACVTGRFCVILRVKRYPLSGQAGGARGIIPAEHPPFGGAPMKLHTSI